MLKVTSLGAVSIKESFLLNILKKLTKLPTKLFNCLSIKHVHLYLISYSKVLRSY